MKINCTLPLPPVLIKVGSKEKVESIIEHGIVSFGTFDYYRNESSPDYKLKLNASLQNMESEYGESEFYTNDPLEGLQAIQYDGKGSPKLTFNNNYSHVLSMFGFAFDVPMDFSINNKMSEFGNYFAIFDTKIFIKNIFPILYKESFFPKPLYDYVTFYEIQNRVNIMALTQFHKKRFYDYQCEYRILANLKDRRVCIGDSLRNHPFSIVAPIEDLLSATLFIKSKIVR